MLCKFWVGGGGGGGGRNDTLCNSCLILLILVFSVEANNTDLLAMITNRYLEAQVF